MKRGKIAALALALLLCGCHSHVINVNVVNGSSEKISNVIIEYPEATFGVSHLDPGKTFQYRLKVTGTGPLKIQFENARGTRRTSTGPVVHKGDEGSLELTFTQEGLESKVQAK